MCELALVFAPPQPCFHMLLHPALSEGNYMHWVSLINQSLFSSSQLLWPMISFHRKALVGEELIGCLFPRSFFPGVLLAGSGCIWSTVMLWVGERPLTMRATSLGIWLFIPPLPLWDPWLDFPIPCNFSLTFPLPLKCPLNEYFLCCLILRSHLSPAWTTWWWNSFSKWAGGKDLSWVSFEA